MYAKTVFAAAAVIAQAAAYSNYTLPSCWSSCFAKYEIDSEDCLCSDSIASVVETCIDSGCSAASSKSYEGWLSSYCNKGAASSSSSSSVSGSPVTVTVETTSYTTICPVTATETKSSSTWTSVYTTTSTVLTSHTKTVPVTSSTASPTTYSTIVKTSTVTSLSSGTPVTSVWTSTKTPGWNTWTSSASVWGTATGSAPAPSGTGSWGPSSPVPYTGAAVHIKAAGALVGAGAFVALLL